LQDFVWWTGLTVQEAKKALEIVKTQFSEVVVNGQSYWMSPELHSTKSSSKSYLLPPFDEYLLGYKDRSSIVDPIHIKKIATINGIFNATIVMNSKVVGTWKRIVKKGTVKIELNPFDELKSLQKKSIESEALRYCEFFGHQLVML
jgi:hypothetical protein